tara:strand:- start:365 stop:691 length:327 start_codon:yes stop_codon:yes gene_type:complete
MHFVFENDNKLKTIARTALDGDHQLPYGEGPAGQAGIWLVKDEGVYLLPANGVKRKPCYAKGFGDDVYIGGDDFVDFIPLSTPQIVRILNHSSRLEITLTDTEIRIEA